MHTLFYIILLFFFIIGCVGTIFIQIKMLLKKDKFISMRDNEIIDLRKGIDKLEENIAQKETSILTLYQKIEQESKRKNELHTRVVELEDGIKNGVGITLRNEITTVKSEFTDVELTIMSNGVYELIPHISRNLSDFKFYILLIEKIQNIVKKMDESKNQNTKGV